MRRVTRADRLLLADPVFARRYDRAAAHDARSDGYFVTGLPMSEIFCRPGCATRTPRPSNVAFYPTPAAAHAAGLTPCPRCRPDESCAPPGLAHGDTVAARAWRLIADGVVDRGGVDGLAALLGLTPRHVRRAVQERTGCGPLALARTVRAHTARLLLRHTSLPVRAVAVAAGFTSVRQFNATFARFYRMPPGAVRRAGSDRSAPGAQEPLVVRCVLPVRAPFAAAVFRLLNETAVADVEDGGDGWYARTVRLPHGPGHLRVDDDGRGRLLAKLTAADPRDVVPLLARVRRLLDLDADPVRIDAALRRDRLLAPLVAARPGLRVPGTVDAEETLFRMILSHGLPAAASRGLLARLAGALGQATPWGLLFPTADRIAGRGRDVLPGADRVDTVVRAARAVASGRLRLHAGMSRAGLAAALEAIPGIAPAVVDGMTARLLGDPDVLPADDPVILRGAARAGMPHGAAALALRRRLWSPWAGYAAAQLWQAARG